MYLLDIFYVLEFISFVHPVDLRLDFFDFAFVVLAGTGGRSSVVSGDRSLPLLFLLFVDPAASTAGVSISPEP